VRARMRESSESADVGLFETLEACIMYTVSQKNCVKYFRNNFVNSIQILVTFYRATPC